MSALTSHVLDLASGQPARGLAVRLEILDGEQWRTLADRITDADGRISDFVPAGALGAATYRLTFATGDYQRAAGRPVFYPWVEIIFTVAHTSAPAQHHHIPLLLSPFGYSTYRGS